LFEKLASSARPRNSGRHSQKASDTSLTCTWASTGAGTPAGEGEGTGVVIASSSPRHRVSRR
jgi:hypothetical protein